MNASPLKSYEGQVRIVLVLLVLFLAVALYLNVHLLLIARNAVGDEAGQRLALEADLVRVELERDQMLRGLRQEPGDLPYIPPTFLDRMARMKGKTAIEILSPAGRVLSSSDPQRVGATDAALIRDEGAGSKRLLSGMSLVTDLERVPGSRYATLGAYRPIQDRSRATIAVIRVEEEVPALAAVDFNLRVLAALQAGGLVVMLVLVIAFARWLLQPYRRLLSAAGTTPGTMSGLGGGGSIDAGEELVAAFEGVLDKLRAQEREVQSLSGGERGGPGEGGSPFPGDHLIAGMTSAVLAFDRDGRLATLNGAAERLLGLGRGEALGRRHGDLLGGNWKLIDLVERSLRQGESHSREMVPLAGPAGRITHLGVMVSPIRPASGGSIEGALCLLADLTEIRALQERVGLKENLAALGEMSAGIAHEFRNALATIQGLARLITRQGSGAAGGAPSVALAAGGAPTGSARDATGVAGEHAEAILREVAAARRVVDDFMRYARPSDLDLQRLDLDAMVRELVRDFAPAAARDGIRVTIEGSFPPIVADETLLRQALLNLLRNAVEAFPAGAPGPAGDVAPGAAATEAGGLRRHVVLRGAAVAERPAGVRLSVEDNGAGIAEADRARIFTPFFTTKDRGTGLGLALVQKAAVLHDGHVEVASGAGGEGTRVSLTLPGTSGTARSQRPRLEPTGTES